MAKFGTASAKSKAAKAKATAVKNKLGNKTDKTSKKKVLFEETDPDPPPDASPDPPPKERNAELDNLRNNDTFITLKLDFAIADAFPTNLLAKYKAFLTILKIVDESLIILSANLANRRDPILLPAKIPTNVTDMIPYFYTTSRPAKDKAVSIWTTARISHYADWEDIIETSRYGLTDDGMLMMYKRIQTLKTQIPGYFQFVDNNADSQDLYAQVCDDIGSHLTLTIHNRESFENNYAAMSANKKKRNNFLPTLHILNAPTVKKRISKTAYTDGSSLARHHVDSDLTSNLSKFSRNPHLLGKLIAPFV